MAEHSRRKDAMLYSEQINNALTITSRCFTGFPKPGQQHSSRGATSLAKSNCSSIRINRWLGLLKSHSCLVVNWNKRGVPSGPVQRFDHRLPRQQRYVPAL